VLIQKNKKQTKPKIYERNQHNISRKLIDHDAIKVMYRLIRHGYKAYLVGGAVRDLLLNKKPKDYDVGTDASPEQVRKLFRNSRIIGRRFRLNHIYFNQNKIIEVATFRALSEAGEENDANVYGDPKSDAVRRDLTINGLFYDLKNYSIIDYVDGMSDLNNGIIRIIGDPETRIKEDPVRMIRAVRHAARTSFIIHEDTYRAICNCKELISTSPKARVYEEFLRDLTGGASLHSMQLLSKTGLLDCLMPLLKEQILNNGGNLPSNLEKTLAEIDTISTSGKELSAAVLFAAIFVDSFSIELFVDTNNEVKPKLTLPRNKSFRSRSRMRKTDKTEEISQLRLQINNMFADFGVPRRQRDLMECILIARQLIINAIEENEKNVDISKASYFPELLLLLSLTAHNDCNKKCLEFAETIGRSKKSSPRKKRSRHKRKPHYKMQK
jgi:poly(A) polymerase